MLYPNIRALREDNDLRQRQLAELLNVSQNTYSQYETGVIALTAEHLVKLADFYHVSVDLYLSRKVDTKNIYFLICFSKVDMKVIF